MLFGSLGGHCPSRHALSTNCNAVAVDSAVDKEHTPALESLKLALEGRRTTAGVEGGPVVRQKTAEEVVHRLLGCQSEPEDVAAATFDYHGHEWTE
jgi:hypothetical protein